MLPTYSIVVRDKSSNYLGEFTNWTNLRFSERMNNYGSCSFSAPVISEELEHLVSMRRYETIVRRNGVDVWAGEQTNRYGSLSVDSPNFITITSHTFEEMLNSMYTPRFVRYENEDEGDILKDLVDTFQAQTNGNLGLTFGTYLTGTNRDREYNTDNILEAFINMSNVLNGPDFYITKNKQINIVKHRGIDKSKNIMLEWKTNIKSISISEDFSTPTTKATVLGAGFGSEQLIHSETNVPLSEVYGLREQRSSEVDVSIQSTLEAKAQALIRKYKQPLQTIQISQVPSTVPDFGSIGLGDSIKIRVDEGFYNIDNTYRVYGYDVSIDKDGKESIEYIIGQI